MKRVDLSVSRLSLAKKLDLMETLWADLSRDEKALKSPGMRTFLRIERRLLQQAK
jgi:hypothetical protein